ncbi:unnamed protein product [Caenorhabditis auriculariae]|uniref:Uncharacterized protein n=1 Tax=Caenorhabditis auriculariae TaxID=2777116 RepID=A0A8S1HVA5_9PELO|nr:unnamed protein product [Caenorhabditis auriculariae]
MRSVFVGYLFDGIREERFPHFCSYEAVVGVILEIGNNIDVVNRATTVREDDHFLLTRFLKKVFQILSPFASQNSKRVSPRLLRTPTPWQPREDSVSILLPTFALKSPKVKE